MGVMAMGGGRRVYCKYAENRGFAEIYIYNWNLAQLYMEVRQQAYIRPTDRKTERQTGIEEYDTKNRDILYQIKT